MNFDVTKFTKQIDQINVYAAQKLQVPMAKVMEILHKEYIYRLCLNGLWFVIGILIILCGLYIIKKFWEKDKDGDYRFDNIEMQFAMSTVGGIISIVGIVIFLIKGTSLLHGLINPEWYIFTEIIKPMMQ